MLSVSKNGFASAREHMKEKKGSNFQGLNSFMHISQKHKNSFMHKIY